MKKNLLRKLTLSAVTMGVAALSVTTSTFAWFTTNGTATATNISGTTTASDLLCLIKAPTSYETSGWNYGTGENAQKYQTSATLVNEAGNDNTTSLQPVAFNSSKNEVKDKLSFTKAGSTSGSFDGNATSSDYLHYQVKVALSSLNINKTTNLKMYFSGWKWADAVKQTLLVTDGKINAGETVNVQLKDALSLGVVVTLNDGSDTNNVATITNGTGIYHAVEESNTSSDAIAYYNNVFNLTGDKAISKPNTYENSYTADKYFSSWDSSTNGLDIVNVPAGQESMVATIDLYFFLDGWDYQCFNKVGGQKLSTTDVTLNFTASQN